MKKIFLAVISVLLLSGCATSAQSESNFSSDDIAFAELMIPHHEQAMEMFEIALLYSSNPDILKLAQQIKDAQSPEIEEMKGWTGVKASTHAGHMMDGMLSGEEIRALRDTQGREFDRLFLEGMIKHHEGAIVMAKAVMNSKNSDVTILGNSIINAQEREILEIKALLLKY